MVMMIIVRSNQQTWSSVVLSRIPQEPKCQEATEVDCTARALQIAVKHKYCFIWKDEHVTCFETNRANPFRVVCDLMPVFQV